MTEQNGHLQEHPLGNDLDHILAHTEAIWEQLRGARLFLTGGTGFFGSWLLESLTWANSRLDLGVSVVVLTRDVGQFHRKAPHLVVNPSISFLSGDIRSFEFPQGPFSHIIHAAATSAMETYRGEDPLEKFDTVVAGTRRVLDFAVHCQAGNLLYTSSGAVYGKQPDGMSHIPEEYTGAPVPFDVSAAWGESKRAAEFLCAYYARKHRLQIKVARCFSFVGPYLPLDIHYAIGNFICDGLNGGPIRVSGDGTPYRSYLYAADLVIWLWTILVRGDSGLAYNVGSEEGITIAVLARVVADCFDRPIEVEIAQSRNPDQVPDRYVPSTQRCQKNLDLKVTIGLKDAIKRTIAWNRANRSLYEQ